MTFTQPCFIRKNTPKLRKELEKLGYKNCILNQNKNNRFIFTIEIGGLFDVCDCETTLKDFTANGFVDCGENEELFLAISALRDDSNYKQLFVVDFDIDNGDQTPVEYHAGDFVYYDMIKDYELLCHKATAEEIIEHFK